jgi:quinol monooxygenase YgiN
MDSAEPLGRLLYRLFEREESTRKFLMTEGNSKGDVAMTAEYTRYRINQDQQPAFEEAYRAAQKYVQASPHCVGYELSHCTEEPERYVLRIEWASVEEHLQGFRKEPNFKSFLGLVQPFVPNIEEMQHYKLTEVVGSGGAAKEKRSVA